MSPTAPAGNPKANDKDVRAGVSPWNVLASRLRKVARRRPCQSPSFSYTKSREIVYSLFHTENASHI